MSSSSFGPQIDPAVASAQFAAALQRAYDELRAAQERVLAGFAEAGAARAAAARLDQFLDALDSFREQYTEQAASFVRTDLPALYAAAATAASPGAGFTWTTFHVEAVTSLAADSYADLLAKSKEAGRVGEAFVRAVRRVSRERVPLAALGNSTPVEQGRKIRDELRDTYGVDQVTYRDGARHSGGEYAQMVARTKTAAAYNLGSLNRWGELEVRYVEVFDGADCGWEFHDSGDKANGTFRRVADALAHPISHPNCRRAFGARPDITTAQQAREAAATTTAAQRADQAASEQAQASQVAERAATRRRASRAARRAERANVRA